MNKSTLAIIALSLFLSACSDDKQPSPTTMSEDNVFKGQVDALNKAKGVEDTLQNSFDQQREKIDSQ